MAENPTYSTVVKIDDNHAALVKSLVMCKKPRHILELGFGSGEACRAILAGLRYNSVPFKYTLVDNWMDFGGAPPEAIRAPEFDGVEFVSSGEFEYFQNCTSQYDLIFSDADHFNTQLWFDHVYKSVLKRDGTLIYHDVTNVGMFPNLLNIYTDVVEHKYHHVLLNRNSLPGERCDRGMLVIFKN